MDAADNSHAVFMTLALCTHNHASRLQRTLYDLNRLKPPTEPWEILLVDNASSDSTPSLLADGAWRPEGVPVRVVREENLGLSHARNRALREASGQYLVFIDDDETAASDWLISYEQAIKDYAPDALGGRIEVLFEEGDRPAWLTDELLGFLGRLDYGEAQWLTERSTPIYGGNFMFRRSVLERIGNFDTGLGRKGNLNIGGEDTEIYKRLLDKECKVRWVQNAVIYHRIQTGKLRRNYFLELHYRLGWVQGSRKRSASTRIPPKYLYGQLYRALVRALSMRFKQGGDYSLRMEMNVAYFVGYILGWAIEKG
jgi:glycosyltransferase involved in cell wall biosynthesis